MSTPLEGCVSGRGARSPSHKRSLNWSLACSGLYSLTTRSTAFGYSRSSASRKITMSPRLLAKPALNAEPCPPFSFNTGTTRSPYPKITSCEPVRRAVVHHDHFRVGVSLVQRAFHSVRKEVLVVIVVDDDAYQRFRHKRSFAIASIILYYGCGGYFDVMSDLWMKNELDETGRCGVLEARPWRSTMFGAVSGSPLNRI